MSLQQHEVSMFPELEFDEIKSSTIPLQIKQLLTPTEASKYLDGAVTAKTLANWRSSRYPTGPAWYQLGREIRYKKEDLDQFIESHKKLPLKV